MGLRGGEGNRVRVLVCRVSISLRCKMRRRKDEDICCGGIGEFSGRRWCGESETKEWMNFYSGIALSVLVLVQASQVLASDAGKFTNFHFLYLHFILSCLFACWCNVLVVFILRGNGSECAGFLSPFLLMAIFWHGARTLCRDLSVVSPKTSTRFPPCKF